ncbi:MAG TPA: hypothetical protein EYM25_06425 [Deltaproteobacteria bacterium]|nr:hypothetical protein [Deltaproteobacteria bacterium]
MRMRSVLKLPLLRILLPLLLWTSLLQAGAFDNTDPRYPERQYRRFLLPNGLKVMLVSDPTLQHGAASLVVGVGSMTDPPEQQGLAHFLEHMLFLGTEKYPDAGSYQEFVATHDGYSNAYTAETLTNYFFEVSGDHLEEALDRFSQFFVAPVFNSDLVGRELKAVDAEHSKNIPNDYRRIAQVRREIYAPGHPARHFATGTLETLRGVTREELLDFYQRHYSSNRMTLAVSGRQSLDTLQDWVVPRFAGVANRKLKTPRLPWNFLPRNDRFRLLKVKTVKDTRSLTLVFPLPSVLRYYKSKPLSLLGFLIGHEGKGSLLSLLKQEGLATGLSAGGGERKRDYASFEITAQLTEEGEKRLRTVITRTFQYLQLLRRISPPPFVYEENRRMTELDYRFAEKEEGTDLVNTLAVLLQFYPMRTLERDPYLITKFDKRLYDSMLFRLIPDNLLAILASRNVKTDQTEQYYGTEYAYTETRAEWVKQWKKAKLHPKLTLPTLNPFIPEDLSVRPFQGKFQITFQTLTGLREEGFPESLLRSLEEAQGRSWNSWESLSETALAALSPEQRSQARGLVLKHVVPEPEVLLDNERGRIWFQQDYRFETPKARIVLLLHSPEVYASPQRAVLSQLSVDVIRESLNEFSYPILLAGMSYSIGVNKEGLSLEFSGYSDKLPELVKTIAGRLRNASVSRATFAELTEKKRRSYQNFHLQQPYQQAFYYRSLLLEDRKFALWDYDREIQKITLKDVKNFMRKNLFKRMYVEGLAYGNLDAETVRETLAPLLDTLADESLPVEEQFREQILQIESGQAHTFSRKMEVENSALVLELQIAQRTPRLRTALMVLSTALQPQFYNELRTQQQLGYIVNAGYTELEETLGLVFMIQSGRYDPNALQQRVDAYFPKFLEGLSQIPEAQLDTLKRSVLGGKLRRSTSISEETSRLFSIIRNRDADFDYNSREIDALQRLTVADLQDILRTHLPPERQRRLVLRMVGSAHEDGPPSGNRIDTIAEFKQAHPCPAFCAP